MKNYKVFLKGFVEVEAENEEDALEKAIDCLEDMYVTDHYEQEESTN